MDRTYSPALCLSIEKNTGIFTFADRCYYDVDDLLKAKIFPLMKVASSVALPR